VIWFWHMPCLVTYVAELMVSHRFATRSSDGTQGHDDRKGDRTDGRHCRKKSVDWIGHGCFNAVVTLAGGSAGALMTNQRGLVHKLSGNDSGPALRGAQDMLLNRRTQRLVLKDLRSSRECKL